MRELDFFLTIEKLSLLARGLDEFLDDHYTLLLKGEPEARKRPLNILCTGLSNLCHELERIAMIDPMLLTFRKASHAFPVDNEDDSGYDKHEINT